MKTRDDPIEAPCRRCGTPFRRAYTEDTCPLCGAATDPERAATRRMLRDRWPLIALCAALAANAAIVVIVARAVAKT